MITITYITQLIFSGQDMHTRGSTTQCLSVVMWQYFSFRTITQLANKNQYFGNNLNILIFRKLLIPNLYLYWECTDPLLINLKLLKCDEINKFLIGRLMYRIYIDDITLFNSMFIKNVQVHNYDTRQKDHYHLPCFKTRLGKISLRYNGVIVWNSILTCGIPVDVSQTVFSKTLKCSIIEGKL